MMYHTSCGFYHLLERVQLAVPDPALSEYFLCLSQFEFLHVFVSNARRARSHGVGNSKRKHFPYCSIIKPPDIWLNEHVIERRFATQLGTLAATAKNITATDDRSTIVHSLHLPTHGDPGVGASGAFGCNKTNRGATAAANPLKTLQAEHSTALPRFFVLVLVLCATLPFLLFSLPVSIVCAESHSW